jgi:hypothetical protein
MAVTIHTTPESYTPSDNPVVWTFSSDQTAQDNFSFIVQVYINDVQVGEEQVFLESGIYAKYNASHYTSNACNIPTISDDIVYQANNYCTCKITVYENYGTPPTNQASAAASNVTTWKAKLNDVDYASWDPADYIYGTNAKFLTQFPITEFSPKVGLENDEQIRLMLFNNLNNVNIAFKLYDADDNLIVSGSYASVVSAYRVIIVNATPSVIVNEAIGIQLTDFQQASYYTVEDASDVVAFRIDLDTDHQYSTAKRIHFISRIGAVESFSFNLISRISGNIQSFGYTRIRGEWNSSAWAYVKSRGSKIGYAKTQDKKMTIESDWLYENIQHWLMDNLYFSPVVWEQDTDGTLIRREIMNPSFEKGVQENDMLLNCTIEISQDSETSMTV